jgi:catechol 2,3-dioxygenase-like lactoylglutathione lyase family enzyme
MQALIEVIILPVVDPDRSIHFYRDMVGFDLDVDYAPISTFRVVQMTPRGSSASIQFGVGLRHVPAVHVTGIHLIVEDIATYRRELAARGVPVSPIRHKDSASGWRGSFRPGLDPHRAEYASFADFSDPDGNGWVIQERGQRRVPIHDKRPPTQSQRAIF